MPPFTTKSEWYHVVAAHGVGAGELHRGLADADPAEGDVVLEPFADREGEDREGRGSALPASRRGPIGRRGRRGRARRTAAKRDGARPASAPARQRPCAAARAGDARLRELRDRAPRACEAQ